MTDNTELITLRNEGDYTLIVEINGKEIIREFFSSGESEINHMYHHNNTRPDKKALDSVDLEPLKQETCDAVMGEGNHGSYAMPIISRAIDHLSPLITRAPNEEALAALDDLTAVRNGDMGATQWIKNHGETVCKALGGNNE